MADERRTTAIWKYPLRHAAQQVITGPFVSPMHVGMDPSGQMCAWVCVWPGGVPIDWTILIVGTGSPIPDDSGAYLGTVHDGSFVWHIFMGNDR